MKPNFSKAYRKEVLNIVRTQAIIEDLEYWKKSIDEAFDEAKERYLADPETYEDDYGWDPYMDADCILEDYDKNGI